MRDIEVIVTIRDTVCSDFVWLVTKSKNAYRLLFNFIKPWNEDLTLQAVFRAPYQEPIVVDLDIDNSCVVPYEATARTGILFVSVRGVYKSDLLEGTPSSIKEYDIVKHTTCLEIPVIKGGHCDVLSNM